MREGIRANLWRVLFSGRVRLRGKMIAFVFVATFLPLAVYGAISIREAHRAAREATLRGNALGASQAATRITQYLRNHREILRTLAVTINPTSTLGPDQVNRVMGSYVLEYRGFRALKVFWKDGTPGPNTRLEAKPPTPEEARLLAGAFQGKTPYGLLRIGDDLVPEMDVVVPIHALGQVVGALLGTVDLVEMWRLVDQIKIGASGYALVIGPGGRMLGAGTSRLKAMVIMEQPVHPTGPISAALAAAGKPPPYQTEVGEYPNPEGVPVVGAALPIADLDWIIVVEQPAEEAYASVYALQERLGILAAVALLLALIASAVAGTRFLRVIDELVQGTFRIARGEFSARVRPRARDEMGDLARDFNTMAEKLDALTREVRRKERMAAFGRIAAGLAHDLKAPFNAIGHQLGLLEDPELRDQAQQCIRHQISHVQHFLNALHGLMQEREAVIIDLDAAALCARVVESFAAQAQSDGSALAVEAAPGLARARAAAFELSRVLENLVKNALEAVSGRPGARVTVRLAEEAGQIAIRVEDNGPGIAPERLPLLFEEFKTTKGSGQGLGLGLATSLRLTEAQGGTLTVQSAPGAGATFTVRVPAALAADVHPLRGQREARA